MIPREEVDGLPILIHCLVVYNLAHEHARRIRGSVFDETHRMVWRAHLFGGDTDYVETTSQIENAVKAQ